MCINPSRLHGLYALEQVQADQREFLLTFYHWVREEREKGRGLMSAVQTVGKLFSDEVWQEAMRSHKLLKTKTKPRIFPEESIH